jgi:UDP-glucose 4-epimerase
MDIRDPRIKELVAEVKPGTVYHAAAQISVSVSAREPAHDAEVNLMGTLNVLDAVRQAPGGHAKFIFVSTGGAMYGEPKQLPAAETLPAMPGSPYGASKHAVEIYLPVYKRLFNINYSIMRLANVYGPRQDPHGEAGVVAIFTRAMLAKKPVTIFGDGTDERDYVYVEDVAEALALAAEAHGEGPYNVGTGKGTNVNELTAHLSRLCGYKLKPNYAAPRPGDIRKISLDARKIKHDMGWEARTPLDEGLAKTVAWFAEN